MFLGHRDTRNLARMEQLLNAGILDGSRDRAKAPPSHCRSEHRGGAKRADKAAEVDGDQGGAQRADKAAEVDGDQGGAQRADKAAEVDGDQGGAQRAGKAAQVDGDQGGCAERDAVPLNEVAVVFTEFPSNPLMQPMNK